MVITILDSLLIYLELQKVEKTYKVLKVFFYSFLVCLPCWSIVGGQTWEREGPGIRKRDPGSGLGREPEKTPTSRLVMCVGSHSGTLSRPWVKCEE